MRKYFNTNGACYPGRHYMVPLDHRLEQIKKMADRGDYFVINRARQYGKTTTLRALKEYLKKDYTVALLSFQKLSADDFETEQAFVSAFADIFLEAVTDVEHAADEVLFLEKLAEGSCAGVGMRRLFKILRQFCEKSHRPVVLMIDEVDSASNNQVFLDFLAQLRDYYLDREEKAAFQSVILAGVYDIKNIKQKIRPDAGRRYNSPWNIAADFNLDMSFSVQEIADMLADYQKEHEGKAEPLSLTERIASKENERKKYGEKAEPLSLTERIASKENERKKYGGKEHEKEMDIARAAQEIYDYTSGYPYLVSRICQRIDEELAGTGRFETNGSLWTKESVLEAVNRMLQESNALFDDMHKKLVEYPDLREMLYIMLFQGQAFPYHGQNTVISVGTMFGLLRQEQGQVQISNRIFEIWLYNLFLSEDAVHNQTYAAGQQEVNRFIQNGKLNMELVLQKFMEHFTEIYKDSPQKFVEENGRRLFLLYLKPIINGTGHYYIESRTRSMGRTDVIIDYAGCQHLIEMKIWHGSEYNEKARQQLARYLDDYGLKRGYLISFNFNKKKEIGMKEITVGDRTLVEIVV